VSGCHLWRRGVDDVRFHPRHRSAGIRRALAPNGEVLVGFVGRLAVEKQVDLLADVSRLPGYGWSSSATGRPRGVAQGAARAVFLGVRHGAQLARIYASLDVFAHTGPYETFGQAVQEAMASGLPVVAPARAGRSTSCGRPDRHLVPPFGPPVSPRRSPSWPPIRLARRRSGAAGRVAIEGRSWSRSATS
jgi:phosphatidylinositol alpha 1,6-mannosyltransferase